MADPQHPDVAALVEQRDRAWKALRFIYRNGMHTDRPKWLDPILSDAFGPERCDGPGMARDAERDRTLARPVEDEEVRQLDALRAEFDQLFGRFTDESARATRAEQEAARLRNSATMVLEAIGALSTLRNGKTPFEGSPIRDPYCAAAWVQLNNAVDECKRAVAGTEEP